MSSHPPSPSRGWGSSRSTPSSCTASEPVLVDTGAVVERDEFLEALRTVVDVADLRWIWLTHTDADHIGALHALLDENADLKVVTTFLGVGAMSLADPLPLDRVHLVNPGQQLEAGGRTLTALRPPTFDNPCTTGFHERRSGALFSADSFGALLADVPPSAADLTEDELREGQTLWATLDSPWLHSVDVDTFARRARRNPWAGPVDDPEQSPARQPQPT